LFSRKHKAFKGDSFNYSHLLRLLFNQNQINWIIYPLEKLNNSFRSSSKTITRNWIKITSFKQCILNLLPVPCIPAQRIFKKKVWFYCSVSYDLYSKLWTAYFERSLNSLFPFQYSWKRKVYFVSTASHLRDEKCRVYSVSTWNQIDFLKNFSSFYIGFFIPRADEYTRLLRRRTIS